MKTVILGAGLCGLTLAHELIDSGWEEVLLVEKSRAVGGRMATRRFGDSKFDHGASFYSLKPPLLKWHQRWQQEDLVQTYFERDHVRRMKSDLGMTALAKSLARDLNIQFEEKVVRLQKENNHWSLWLENGHRIKTDQVVLTAPLPQALEILTLSDLSFPPQLQDIPYAKALVGLFEDITSQNEILGFDGYLEISSGDLFSISNQKQKGLSKTNSWSVVMSPDFSERCFDLADDMILEKIQNAVKDLCGEFGAKAAQLKKWRYSHPLKTADQGYQEIQPGLYLAGDAFGGPSLSGAAHSALSLARHLLSQ